MLADLVRIHHTSEIDENVKIGKGTKIWHFCHVSEGVEIGENCVLGQNVFVGKNVKIGNGCKIQNNVSIFEGCVLEDNVFMGPSSTTTNVLNPRANVERKDEFKETIFREGCSIGANATIICGNEIGRYAMVGAGSVVTRNIMNYSLSYGIPASHMGLVCKCGNVLSKYRVGEVHLKIGTTKNDKCKRCELLYDLVYRGFQYNEK